MNKSDIFIDKIMRYMRVLIYPFVILATIGLVLTLIAHFSMWAGFDNLLGKYTIKLFIGIPVVWLPTALVIRLLTRDSEQKALWKVCLRECPVWMKHMSSVFLIYAFIGFGFLLFGIYTDIKHGSSGNGLPKFVSLGMSGICMMFYSTAIAVLYSAKRRNEKV